MESGTGRPERRLGIGVAILTAIGIVWTCIVRDDGEAAGYFMTILAAVVAGFAARFRSDGMARAMLGVAAMQVALGLLVATAPITATRPGGVALAVWGNIGFTALWLLSAALLHAAARIEALIASDPPA